MKKVIRYFLFAIFVLISFYATEKTAIFIRNQDPLLNEIKEASNLYNVSPIDALIIDNYIIPGLVGKKIDEIKSLINMRENNTFNELFLVMDDVYPDISLQENMDKIIIKGNEKKKMVSIVLNSNKFIDYFKSKNISVSVLVNNESYNTISYGELINNDFINYKEIEKYLDSKKINSNICIVNNNNEDICRKNNKYLVSISKVLDNSNYIDIKNNLESGDIILISDNTSIDYIDLLIHYINSKSLKIEKLSTLIME